MEYFKNNIVFDFDLKSAGIREGELESTLKKLEPEIDRVASQLHVGYETEYASLNLPGQNNFLDYVAATIKEKKKLNIDAIIVIGIGGSNLGTIAVHRALHGDFCNEKRRAKEQAFFDRDNEKKDCGSVCSEQNSRDNLEPEVYFADTIDTDYIFDLLNFAEIKLKAGKNIIINLITKSGTTTESVANFEVFLHLLKKYKPKNYYEYIVAITDAGSVLEKYAKKNNITCLNVPQKVGGRYSVFSPVGLFPLGFLDVDTKKLLQGANSINKNCLKKVDSESFYKKGIENNWAAISAATIYLNYISGKNIHDTFIFSKYLKYFGCWYRQLVGESLGKKLDKEGKLVEVGITPITSVGSVDLHSMVQLDLGGPRDKFTTFITVDPNHEIFIPKENEFEEFVENIHGKSLRSVMIALASGTKEAYKKDGRPFVSMYIPKLDEYCLGQLLQFKMFEIIYLGFLLGVNPFDQPQVELYKKEARKILMQS